MKTCCVLLLLLASASASYAQDAPSLRLPANLYLLAAGADAASTAYCFQASPHCGESNPAGKWLRREVGSPAMFAAGAAFDVASVWAVQKWVAPKHPKIARVAFYAGTAVRVWLTAENIRRGRLLSSCRAPIPQAC